MMLIALEHYVSSCSALVLTALPIYVACTIVLCGAMWIFARSLTAVASARVNLARAASFERTPPEDEESVAVHRGLGYTGMREYTQDDILRANMEPDARVTTFDQNSEFDQDEPPVPGTTMYRNGAVS